MDVALRAPRGAGLLGVLALALPLAGFVLDSWHRVELGFPRDGRRGEALGWSIFAALALGAVGLAIERGRTLRCRACGRRSRLPNRPHADPTS